MAKPYRLVTLDALEIEDDRAFAAVPLYASLRDVLRRAKYRFRVLSGDAKGRADHALLLNLTYWSAEEAGDVLAEPKIPADVVAHVAWHHLAWRALPPKAGNKPSADALFLGESIASAFDLTMIGHVLRSGKRSRFLDSQVPRLAEVAQAAGLSARDFEAVLGDVAAAPEIAFGDLRALLFDTTRALFDAKDGIAAAEALAAADAHPFGALLHHYELSNWVLYARAYGDARPDARARKVDRALRDADDPVAWLAEEWLSRSASSP